MRTTVKPPSSFSRLPSRGEGGRVKSAGSSTSAYSYTSNLSGRFQTSPSISSNSSSRNQSTARTRGTTAGEKSSLAVSKGGNKSSPVLPWLHRPNLLASPKNRSPTASSLVSPRVGLIQQSKPTKQNESRLLKQPEKNKQTDFHTSGTNLTDWTDTTIEGLSEGDNSSVNVGADSSAYMSDNSSVSQNESRTTSDSVTTRNISVASNDSTLKSGSGKSNLKSVKAGSNAFNDTVRTRSISAKNDTLTRNPPSKMARVQYKHVKIPINDIKTNATKPINRQLGSSRIPRLSYDRSSQSRSSVRSFPSQQRYFLPTRAICLNDSCSTSITSLSNSRASSEAIELVDNRSTLTGATPSETGSTLRYSISELSEQTFPSSKEDLLTSDVDVHSLADYGDEKKFLEEEPIPIPLLITPTSGKSFKYHIQAGDLPPEFSDDILDGRETDAMLSLPESNPTSDISKLDITTSVTSETEDQYEDLIEVESLTTNDSEVVNTDASGIYSDLDCSVSTIAATGKGQQTQQESERNEAMDSVEESTIKHTKTKSLTANENSKPDGPAISDGSEFSQATSESDSEFVAWLSFGSLIDSQDFDEFCQTLMLDEPEVLVEKSNSKCHSTPVVVKSRSPSPQNASCSKSIESAQSWQSDATVKSVETLNTVLTIESPRKYCSSRACNQRSGSNCRNDKATPAIVEKGKNVADDPRLLSVRKEKSPDKELQVYKQLSGKKINEMPNKISRPTCISLLDDELPAHGVLPNEVETKSNLVVVSNETRPPCLKQTPEATEVLKNIARPCEVTSVNDYAMSESFESALDALICKVQNQPENVNALQKMNGSHKKLQMITFIINQLKEQEIKYKDVQLGSEASAEVILRKHLRCDLEPLKQIQDNELSQKVSPEVDRSQTGFPSLAKVQLAYHGGVNEKYNLPQNWLDDVQDYSDSTEADSQIQTNVTSPVELERRILTTSASTDAQTKSDGFTPLSPSQSLGASSQNGSDIFHSIPSHNQCMKTSDKTFEMRQAISSSSTTSKLGETSAIELRSLTSDYSNSDELCQSPSHRQTEKKSVTEYVSILDDAVHRVYMQEEYFDGMGNSCEWDINPERQNITTSRHEKVNIVDMNLEQNGVEVNLEFRKNEITNAMGGRTHCIEGNQSGDAERIANPAGSLIPKSIPTESKCVQTEAIDSADVSIQAVNEVELQSSSVQVESLVAPTQMVTVQTDLPDNSEHSTQTEVFTVETHTFGTQTFQLETAEVNCMTDDISIRQSTVNSSTQTSKGCVVSTWKIPLPTITAANSKKAAILYMSPRTQSLSEVSNENETTSEEIFAVSTSVQRTKACQVDLLASHSQALTVSGGKNNSVECTKVWYKQKPNNKSDDARRYKIEETLDAGTQTERNFKGLTAGISSCKRQRSTLTRQKPKNFSARTSSSLDDNDFRTAKNYSDDQTVSCTTDNETCRLVKSHRNAGDLLKVSKHFGKLSERCQKRSEINSITVDESVTEDDSMADRRVLAVSQSRKNFKPIEPAVALDIHPPLTHVPANWDMNTYLQNRFPRNSKKDSCKQKEEAGDVREDWIRTCMDYNSGMSESSKKRILQKLRVCEQRLTDRISAERKAVRVVSLPGGSRYKKFITR